VSVGGNALTFNSGVWSTTVGPVTYTFTQSTGMLLVVPEPGSAVLLLSGLGVLLGFQRSRRRL